MFVAIYEFEIKEGFEEKFKSSWLKVTQGIYSECASLGSRLHTTDKPNILIAYAQWPNKDTWCNSEIQGDVIKAEREKMRDCIVSSKTVYEMDTVEDYLQDQVYAVEQGPEK